ncbi:MAG: hypothetical protein AAGA48_08100 [Myxococcota bacterium]
MMPLLLGLLSSPAVATDAPPLPQGRLEVAPLVGGAYFARKFGLRASVVYGGELSHHFLFDHEYLVVGMFARVYGSQSGFSNLPDTKVDVVIGSAGASLGLRGLGRFMPFVRAGSGFLFADATPSGFEVRGRVGYEVALGARYYPVDWLVVRGEVGAFMHDNLPLGAGSGQAGNAIHWFPIVSLGVVR